MSFSGGSQSPPSAQHYQHTLFAGLGFVNELMSKSITEYSAPIFSSNSP